MEKISNEPQKRGTAQERMIINDTLICQFTDGSDGNHCEERAILVMNKEDKHVFVCDKHWTMILNHIIEEFGIDLSCN